MSRAGVEAALLLLESLAGGAAPLAHHRLLILPCVNPSGLADGTRANRIGQDINRQFHADRTQESAAVRGFPRSPAPSCWWICTVTARRRAFTCSSCGKRASAPSRPRFWTH